jgi:hypothetical protein
LTTFLGITWSWKIPAAFVTELDRKVQELKEEFTYLSYQLAVQDMEKMGSLHFLHSTIKNGNILIRDSRVCRGKSAAITYEIIM